MQWPRQLFAGWRGLGRFWLVVLGLLVVTGAVLQFAGPPTRQAPHPVASQAAAPQPPRKEPERPPRQDTATAPAIPRPGRTTPGPIADPEPALLEPVTGSTTEFLPRIATDGRMPMQVYAAGFDTTSRRPRVGLVLAGIGLNQADSEAAIRALPRAITLAVSPYAKNPAKVLSVARSSEHEYLVSIPMEPQGYPLNDPGNHGLITSLPVEQNRTRLTWLLSRFAGYVGAVGAEGAMRGERFASLPEDAALVLAELAGRGLLYVDPRPGAERSPLAWSRTVDIVIDEPATAADIDEKLAKLASLAREKGSALGFAGTVRPVTTQRLVAWAGTLAADGLALAPVSALALPPEVR